MSDVNRLYDLYQDFESQASNAGVATTILDRVTLKRYLTIWGIELFTVRLPVIGDNVMVALETGTEPHGPFLVLEPAIRQLFSSRDHSARVTPLRFIRQLTLGWKKIRLPHSKEVEAETVQGFLRRVTNSRWPKPQLIESYKGAQDVAARLLSGLDLTSGTPAHGPGIVATGELGPQKMGALHRTDPDMERYFPPWRWYHLNLRHYFDSKRYQAYNRDYDFRSHVYCVPKDSRGPRIICAEPLEKMWIQQSVRSVLQPALEWRSYGRIQFTDQSINASLALESSLTREYATLDMSDASDLVTVDAVDWLLAKCSPVQREILLRSVRTERFQTKDGKDYPLMAYAPMGSALCFVIESLFFYCIASHVVNSLAHSLARMMPDKDVTFGCYVYGDDIIIPTYAAGSVMSALRAFGMIPSERKSYIRSYFRESCGTDAYYGVKLPLVYLRSGWRSKSKASVLEHIAYHNNLIRANYGMAAARVRKWITDSFGMQTVLPLRMQDLAAESCLLLPDGDLPHIHSILEANLDQDRALVFIDDDGNKVKGRTSGRCGWSPTSKKLYVRLTYLQTSTQRVDGWSGLMDALLKSEARGTRFPRRQRLNYRWVALP